MANRKTNDRVPEKEQKRNSAAVSVRIDRLVDNENSKVKAIASVTIGDAFAVHGLKIIDSQKGLFVQMPQNSFQKNGKTEYMDVFHPVTSDARGELNDKVLEAYDQKLAENESEDEEIGEGDNPDEEDKESHSMVQSM